jgi:hypothetical protein
MTIAEIWGKFEDRNRRVEEIAGKIKAVKAEIASLDERKAASVAGGSSEQAIELLRARRDKEDELQILLQVLESVKTANVTHQGEISAVWADVCADVKAEFDNEILPELQAAFERYTQAVDAVAALRQKAHIAAAQLDRMAKLCNNCSTHFKNPFQGLGLNKYYPERAVMAKLNSGEVNITTALDFSGRL